MKNTVLISILLLFTNWSLVAGYACPDTLILGTQTYACNTVYPSRVFDSKSFTIPTGQKSLTISFNIKVTSICSMPSPQHLVVASVGTKRFMDFVIDGDKTPSIFTNDRTGTRKDIYYVNKDFPMDQWITMIATIDTVAETFAGAIAIPTVHDAGKNNAPITNMVVPDSTMKISVCSDIDGKNRIACQISNLKVMYKTYTSTELFWLALGTEPVLVGLYKFKEGSGFTTNSGITTLGTANFGSSNPPDAVNSPTWVSGEKALSFTSKSQYVTIPTPALAPSNNRANTFSFSVHFWFKPTAAPGASGDPIFKYTSSDLATTRIGVGIGSAYEVEALIGALFLSDATAQKFSLSAWTQVTARFILLDELTDVKTTFIAVEFGGTPIVFGKFNTVILSSVFQPTDVLRIGGFIGQIADLRIFSPGAYYMSTTTCTNQCPFDLGATSPATCFQPDCSSGSFATTCIDCPATCTSCSGPSICRTCPAGSGLSGGSCSVCSAGASAATFTSPCKGPTVITSPVDPDGNGNPNPNFIPQSEVTESNSKAGVIGIAVGATIGGLMLLGIGYYIIAKKMKSARNAVRALNQNSQVSVRPDHNQTISMDMKTQSIYA